MSEKLKRFKGFKLPESEIAVLKELENILKKGRFEWKENKWRIEVKDNHVITLYLRKCDLTQIPNVISNLRFIKRLYFENNHISILPEFLGDLKYLEYVRMQGNPIETLPQWILNRHPTVTSTNVVRVIVPSAVDPKTTFTIYLKDLYEKLLFKEKYSFTNFSDLIRYINTYMKVAANEKLLEFIDKLNYIGLGGNNRVNFVLRLLKTLSDKTPYKDLILVRKILDRLGTSFLEELIESIIDENGFLRYTALNALFQVDNSEVTRNKVREKIFQSKIKYGGVGDLFDILEALLNYLQPEEIFELIDKTKELVKDHNNSSKELISLELIYAFIGKGISEQGKKIIRELGHLLVGILIDHPRLDNGEIDEEEALEVERIFKYVDIDKISDDGHRLFAQLLMEEKRDKETSNLKIEIGDVNENKSLLIKYIGKLEKEYHKSRTGFFRQEYRGVDLYPRTPQKETMFTRLLQKIQEPSYTISESLLTALGDAINKLKKQRQAKPDLLLTYINDIIFTLDDLLALIIFEYFQPFSHHFNAFLELVVVLDVFIVEYLNDYFKKIVESHHEDWSNSYLIFEEGPLSMHEVFDNDSYEKGYNNIKSFLYMYDNSYGNNQAVMIKIVNNKLQIVYNKKARAWYYKRIDEFNRKKYKFDLEKEKLKRDNQEWNFAFLNKYYFRDETLNELSDKIFLNFLEKLKTSSLKNKTLPSYIKEGFDTQIEISINTKKLEVRFLIFLDLLNQLQEHKYVAFYNLIDAIGKKSALTKFHTHIKTYFFNFVAESEKLNQEAKSEAMKWLIKIAIKTGLLTDYIDLYFKAMNTFPNNNKYLPFQNLIDSIKISELLKLNAFQLEKQFLDLIQSIGIFKHDWVPYQSFSLLLKVAKGTDLMKKHYSLLLDVFPKLPEVKGKLKFSHYQNVIKEVKGTRLAKESAFKKWKGKKRQP